MFKEMTLPEDFVGKDKIVWGNIQGIYEFHKECARTPTSCCPLLFPLLSSSRLVARPLLFSLLLSLQSRVSPFFPGLCLHLSHFPVSPSPPDFISHSSPLRLSSFGLSRRVARAEPLSLSLTRSLTQSLSENACKRAAATPTRSTSWRKAESSEARRRFASLSPSPRRRRRRPRGKYVRRVDSNRVESSRRPLLSSRTRCFDVLLVGTQGDRAARSRLMLTRR